MTVLEAAKDIMRASGNLHQWVNGYPSAEVIRDDIHLQQGYVLEEGHRLVGYFTFMPSPEPTYSTIYGGAWLDDERPYHVIHRIASLPDVHGVFTAIMDFAFAHSTTSSNTDSRTAASSISPPGTRAWPTRN